MLAGLHSDTRVSTHAILQQFGDFRLFPNRDAVFAGVIKHHLVELAAQHLPRLRHRFAVIPIEEIKRLGSMAVGLDEAHAVLLDECRRAQARDHAQAFERAETERDE